MSNQVHRQTQTGAPISAKQPIAARVLPPGLRCQIGNSTSPLAAPDSPAFARPDKFSKPNQAAKATTQLPHRPPRALWRIAAALAVICLLLIALSQALGSENVESGATSGAPNATVVKVIDGDTIEVSLARKSRLVRLIGVDTPETVHPTKPVECFGPQASQFTASQLPEKSAVRLVLDAEPKDRYGRLLAYVYRGSDNVFINHEIARRGFARPLSIAPNTAHSDDMAEAARLARIDNLGIWSNCPSK